ncbi:NACHT, LRR and PYD domains-containing protein 3-like protein, partial [Lates japonicus]
MNDSVSSPGEAQSSRDQTLLDLDLDLDPASDVSKNWFINFKGQHPSADQIVDQESSEVPSGQSAQQHQTHLDSIFMLLEENIATFVKNEL